jgi:hypothetical protein
MKYSNPLPAPENLRPRLFSVFSYWRDLDRAENAMPFSDDIDYSALSRLSDNIFILKVLVLPERFRFELLGKALQTNDKVRTGSFIDEIDPGGQFSYLRAQSSATVEAAAPTYLHLTGDADRDFSRLLLPTWGNGHIDMLVGAVDP